MTQNLMAATSLLPKLLASIQLSATTATTVYTVPAGGAAVVKQGTLCNTGGSAVTVSVAVVPSGGTADGTHRLISGYSLAAGDTLPLRDYLGDLCLGPGDFIAVTASTANVVDVILSGSESA